MNKVMSVLICLISFLCVCSSGLFNAKATCRESRRPVAVLSPHRASLTDGHGGACPDLGGGARGNGHGRVRHGESLYKTRIKFSGHRSIL